MKFFVVGREVDENIYNYSRYTWQQWSRMKRKSELSGAMGKGNTTIVEQF